MIKSNSVISMETNKCKICGEREATKTNSHLLPAFLEAVVGSYDHSYRRDRDVLITKTKYSTRIHTGALPSTEYERLFDQDKLTDERIKNELSDNPCAVDYIFCPQCESALSDVLESKYPEQLKTGRPVDRRLSFFFWLSVVWRMSVGGIFGFRFPDDIENKLGRSLDSYMNGGLDDDAVDRLIEKTPFCYKLFQCKDYCRNPEHGGMIHCWLSDSRKSLMCMIGDFGLEVCFAKEFKSESLEYFLNKAVIDEAPLNTGMADEEIYHVSEELWQATHKGFIAHGKRVIAEGYLETLARIWETMKAEGCIVCDGGMPWPMAMWILKEMLDDKDVKMGDKHTPERWHHLVCMALEHPEFWNGK